MLSHESSSLASVLAGRHILVTGGTGFVGKVWIAMLLERLPTIGRITLLVRSTKRETALRRFERIVETSPCFRPLRQHHGAKLGAYLGERVSIVEGDVAKPLCGLDETSATRLALGLDAIVHFAGLTDFEPDPLAAISINIRGAVHAADLASRMETPQLLHVSTTFVAGMVSGPVAEEVSAFCPAGKPFDAAAELRALEEECARIAPPRGSVASAVQAKRERIAVALERARALGWPNIYTYTKGLAEHLLTARRDVHVTIARPSIVECAVRYPFAGWNEGINTSGPLFWLLGSAFRELPSQPEHRFDVIPVDTVCRGITLILAAMLTRQAAPVYHLASSDTNPLTFGRAIELTGLFARRHHRRKDATPYERYVLQFLDAVPVSAEKPGWLSVPRLRNTAAQVNEWLKKIEVPHTLPAALQRFAGPEIQHNVTRITTSLNRIDVRLGRIENMLRLYRPFIHDHDYEFSTHQIHHLSAALSADDAAWCSFDVRDLDWRTYWLDVQGPGLQTWCFPLLYGERAPLDPRHDPPFALVVRPTPHESAQEKQHLASLEQIA